MCYGCLVRGAGQLETTTEDARRKTQGAQKLTAGQFRFTPHHQSNTRLAATGPTPLPSESFTAVVTALYCQLLEVCVVVVLELFRFRRVRVFCKLVFVH
jgi:hypothetical protein